MTQKSGTPPIVYIILVLAVLGGGYWFFSHQSQPPKLSKIAVTPFPAPVSVPSGTNVKIAGATTMVQINQALKQGFQRKFPGTLAITLIGFS